MLPTNKYLHMCALVESEKCYYCKLSTETLAHLFHKCSIVLKLWYNIADWLNPCLDIYPYINTECIIFGIDIKYNHKLVNHLLLIIKRYIYVTKIKNEYKYWKQGICP